jgi:integrase
MPPDNSYIQWRDHAYYQWRTVNKDTGIKGFHDMRAAFACEHYQALTGFPAPVVTGTRQADKTLDTQARVLLSQQLGHNRLDVIAAYIGSSK